MIDKKKKTNNCFVSKNTHTHSDTNAACLSEKFRVFRKLHSNEELCWWRTFFRPVWVDLVFTSRILLPANMSTMINTFHSSFNPPPVPPRPGPRGGPALPSNTPLVKFLSVLLLLLMIQTFGGFLYLFHRINLVGIYTLYYYYYRLVSQGKCLLI